MLLSCPQVISFWLNEPAPRIMLFFVYIRSKIYLSTNIADSLSFSMDVSYLYYVAVAANFTTFFAKILANVNFIKTFSFVTDDGVK